MAHAAWGEDEHGLRGVYLGDEEGDGDEGGEEGREGKGKGSRLGGGRTSEKRENPLAPPRRERGRASPGEGAKTFRLEAGCHA